MKPIFKTRGLSFQIKGRRVVDLNIALPKGSAAVISSADYDRVRDFFQVMENPALKLAGELVLPNNHALIYSADEFSDRLKGGDELELARLLSGNGKAEAYALAGKYEISHLLSLKTAVYDEYEKFRLKLAIAMLTNPLVLLLEEPFLKLSAADQAKAVGALTDYLAGGGAILIGSRRPHEFSSISPTMVDLLIRKREAEAGTVQSDFALDGIGGEPSAADWPRVPVSSLLPELTQRIYGLPQSEATDYKLRRIPQIHYFERCEAGYLLEYRPADEDALDKELKTRGLLPGAGRPDGTGQ